MESKKKGFTLIELLIVIGILAVLATIVVLVLNPAQLFAQARDSRRVEDLNSLRSAVNFYLTTVASPDLASQGANCAEEATPRFWSTIGGATSNFSGPSTQLGATATTSVSGTGWVPVNLASSSGGSPLPVLPTDPLNPDTTTYNYQYACNQTNGAFEVNANLESTRYTTAPDNLEDSDGGDDSTIYEVGNDPGLDL